MPDMAVLPLQFAGKRAVPRGLRRYLQHQPPLRVDLRRHSGAVNGIMGVGHRLRGDGYDLHHVARHCARSQSHARWGHCGVSGGKATQAGRRGLGGRVPGEALCGGRHLCGVPGRSAARRGLAAVAMWAHLPLRVRRPLGGSAADASAALPDLPTRRCILVLIDAWRVGWAARAVPAMPFSDPDGRHMPAHRRVIRAAGPPALSTATFHRSARPSGAGWFFRFTSPASTPGATEEWLGRVLASS
mmetsp:Transcript_3067/g.8765  ORF Transcript_3067/g.8765 Transcript_3067/m.8765 type:complete len:244 (+) Transcript_3067:169-900(+)